MLTSTTIKFAIFLSFIFIPSSRGVEYNFKNFPPSSELTTLAQGVKADRELHPSVYERDTEAIYAFNILQYFKNRNSSTPIEDRFKSHFKYVFNERMFDSSIYPFTCSCGPAYFDYDKFVSTNVVRAIIDLISGNIGEYDKMIRSGEDEYMKVSLLSFQAHYSNKRIADPNHMCYLDYNDHYKEYDKLDTKNKPGFLIYEKKYGNNSIYRSDNFSEILPISCENDGFSIQDKVEVPRRMRGCTLYCGVHKKSKRKTGQQDGIIGTRRDLKDHSYCYENPCFEISKRAYIGSGKDTREAPYVLQSLCTYGPEYCKVENFEDFSMKNVECRCPKDFPKCKYPYERCPEVYDSFETLAEFKKNRPTYKFLDCPPDTKCTFTGHFKNNNKRKDEEDLFQCLTVETHCANPKYINKVDGTSKCGRNGVCNAHESGIQKKLVCDCVAGYKYYEEGNVPYKRIDKSLCQPILCGRVISDRESIYKSTIDESFFISCGNHGTCVETESVTDYEKKVCETKCTCYNGFFNMHGKSLEIKNPASVPQGHTRDYNPHRTLSCRAQDLCPDPEYFNIYRTNPCKCSACQCIPAYSSEEEVEAHIDDFDTLYQDHPKENGYYIIRYSCNCASGWVNNTKEGYAGCVRIQCEYGEGVESCTSDHNGLNYICKPGFFGRDTGCKNADYCIVDNYNATCANGGYCTSPANDRSSLRCTCPKGFSGPTCQIEDICITRYSQSNKCLTNRGKCSERSTPRNEFCDCFEGYTGDRCHLEDGCDYFKKNNKNICQYAVDTSEPNGVSKCTPSQKITRAYSCSGTCIQGWYGEACDIEDRCETEPGLCNRPTCPGCCVSDKTQIVENKPGDGEVLHSHYAQSCQCTPEFTTKFVKDCSIKNLCFNFNDCLNGGKCTFKPSDTDVSCICPKKGFFYGNRCEKINFCAMYNKESPCGEKLNKGNNCAKDETWEAYVSGGSGGTDFDQIPFQCECADRFRPLDPPSINRCIEDPCIGFLCHNGGIKDYVVKNEEGVCECRCKEGFYGTHCEFKNRCKNDPCNGYPCTPDGNGFICDCDQKKFFPNCTVRDPCLINPSICDNVALKDSSPSPINTCIRDERRSMGYRCKCAVGWTQSKSSNAPNCFEQDLCNHPDTKCYGGGTRSCSYVAGGGAPVCLCDETKYYTGPLCQTQDICSPLLSSPYCVSERTEFGGCTSSGPTTATCSCEKGFHGPRCEFIDACVNGPCRNGGSCEAVGNTFRCTCLPTHWGKLCEDIDKCFVEKPCHNGFSCVRDKSLASGWSCNCGPEFRLLPNCSLRDPCVVDNKCQNGGICTRKNNNEYKCNCTGTKYGGEICQVLKSIIQVSYPDETKVGETALFIVHFHEVGNDPLIKVSFDDDFTIEFNQLNFLSTENITSRAQKALLGQKGFDILKTIPSSWKYYAFTHVFTSPRTYNVRTTVKNQGILTKNYAKAIVCTESPDNCLPDVKLRNCGHVRRGRQDENVPTFERKSRFVIASSIYFKKCSPKEGTQFLWDLYRLTPDSPFPIRENAWNLEKITSHEDGDKKHIIFNPYSLLEGEYWIQLFVYYEEKATKKPIGNLDWCYFNLENSPPRIIIEGGNMRVVHLGSLENNKIIVNASGSIDENEPLKPSLKFKWSYTINGQRISCTPDFYLKRDCTGSIFELDVDELKGASSVDFHVDVTSERANEESKTSVAMQKVTIQTEGIEVTTRCVENCVNFNPGDRVLFECSCKKCEDETMSYAALWQGRSNVEKVGGNLFYVTLEENPAGTELLFSCIGNSISSGSHSSTSSLSITINTPPQLGTCSLSPNTPSNNPLKNNPNNLPNDEFEPEIEFLSPSTTPLSLSCTHFNDGGDDEPITYTLYSSIESSRDEFLPDGILLGYSVYPVMEVSYLPLGISGKEFRVGLRVYGTDAKGLRGSEAVNVTTIVRYPTLGRRNPSLSYLENARRAFRPRLFSSFVDSNPSSPSTLSLLLKGGDNMRAMELILSFLVTQKDYPRKSWKDLTNRVSDSDWGLVSESIVNGLRKVPLYNYLIVKQELQALYLLSFLAPLFRNDTLFYAAQELSITARYMRNYVVNSQEEIHISDIVKLGIAGKVAAENLMVESQLLGQKLIRNLEMSGREKEQVKEIEIIRQEAQVGRDYFEEISEEDENLNEDNTLGDLENNQMDNIINNIKHLSEVCQRAFSSMIHLLDAVAFREVLNTPPNQIISSQFPEPKVIISVELKRLDDLADTNILISPTTTLLLVTPEVVGALKRQNAQNVQVQIREITINPYFGDLDPISTSVVSIEFKSDETIHDLKVGESLRVSNLSSTISIRIPIINTTISDSVDPLQEIDNSVGEIQSVELVPFYQIHDLNPNIRIFHMSLTSGSSFHLHIRTLSPGRERVEYQAAFVKDFNPTSEDFCRRGTSSTQRFSSGDSVQFSTLEAGGGAGEDDAEFGDYFLGIWPFDPNNDDKNQFGTLLNYSVHFAEIRCLTRDEDLNSWTGKGCSVSEFIAGQHIKCACHHLSIFAGSILIPPNKIDVVKDLELFLEIPSNWVVLATLSFILLLYTCCHFVFLWLDRNDPSHKIGMHVLCPIGESFSHSFFLVNVVTGSRIYAGTTANVCIQLFGSTGATKTYVLKDPTLQVLSRGGNDSFLVSSEKDLGELERVRVWHDNSGSDPSWYLRKIIVRNIKTGKRWYFFANTWLSITFEKDAKIIREFSVATPKEIASFKRRFSERLVEEFNNSHLWFSIFFFCPTSNFTRCQRLAVSVGVLTTYMLANIMWEGIPTLDPSTVFDAGIFEFNLGSFLLSLQMSLFVATPVGIIFQFIFKIRKKLIPTLIVWKDQTKRTEALRTYRDEIIFLPDSNGEFLKKVIRADVGGGGDGGDFSIPGTDIEATEKWIFRDTRGVEIMVPASKREPDAFVHRIDTHEKKIEKSELLEEGRRVIAEEGRKLDPSSFIYEGTGDFESQFDTDVYERIFESPKEGHGGMSLEKLGRIKKKEIGLAEERARNEKDVSEPIIVVDRDSEGTFLSQHGITMDVYLMPPVYKKKGYFPWWFLSVAWTFSITTILLTSFFTIYYGLIIGRLRSLHWLSQISLSFFINVLISQPLRIILLSAFLAWKYTKIHATEEDRFQVIVYEGEENCSEFKKLCVAIFRPFKDYPPLLGPILHKLRLIGLRRNELIRGAFAFLAHFIVMLFVFCIIWNSSATKYAVTSHIRDMLSLNNEFSRCSDCSNKFTKISTVTDIYEYLEYFANVVSPGQDYRGSDIAQIEDNKFSSIIMSDNETMVIGVPRLRLKITQISKCPIPETLKLFYLGNETQGSFDELHSVNCTPSYSEDLEERGTFNPFWRPLLNSTRSWTSSNDVWRWRNSTETGSITESGEVGVYSGGGYVAELGITLRRSISVINYLRQTRWIDLRARVLFIELSLMVPNVNLFADVLLTLERSISGTFVATSKVTPLYITVSSEESTYQKTWLVICYSGIALFSLFLTIDLIRSLIFFWPHYGWAIFYNLWLWTDAAITILIWASLGVSISLKLSITALKEKLDSTLVNEFVSLQAIAKLDYLHLCLFSILFALCLLKLWKYLILTFDTFYVMSLTLRLTAKFLLGFTVLILLLQLGFAFWAWIAFGHAAQRFRNIGTSFLELTYLLMSPVFYTEVTKSQKFLGSLFFICFGFVTLILVNLFVALINSGLIESRKVFAESRHRKTYWTLLKNSSFFTSLFSPPIKSGTKPESRLPIPPARVEAMEKLTAEFLRGVLKNSVFERMREMETYCNEVLLVGTGFRVIKKEEKRREVREKMNTTLSVSEVRMERMRKSTVAYLRKRLQYEITKEEAVGHSEFVFRILQLKITKIEQMLSWLSTQVPDVIAGLEEDERSRIEAEEERKREEALREEKFKWGRVRGRGSEKMSEEEERVRNRKISVFEEDDIGKRGRNRRESFFH